MKAFPLAVLSLCVLLSACAQRRTAIYGESTIQPDNLDERINDATTNRASFRERLPTGPGLTLPIREPVQIQTHDANDVADQFFASPLFWAAYNVQLAYGRSPAARTPQPPAPMPVNLMAMPLYRQAVNGQLGDEVYAEAHSLLNQLAEGHLEVYWFRNETDARRLDGELVGTLFHRLQDLTEPIEVTERGWLYPNGVTQDKCFPAGYSGTTAYRDVVVQRSDEAIQQFYTCPGSPLFGAQTLERSATILPKGLIGGAALRFRWFYASPYADESYDGPLVLASASLRHRLFYPSAPVSPAEKTASIAMNAAILQTRLPNDHFIVFTMPQYKSDTAAGGNVDIYVHYRNRTLKIAFAAAEIAKAGRAQSTGS